MTTVYLTRGDIAKLAGVGSLTPYAWERRGAIAAVARTAGGIKLFEQKAITQFLAQRKRRLSNGRPARSR